MDKSRINYSQNEEQSVILDFFKGKKRHLLDIGANDGKTFSNSLALIEDGWSGVLVEPNKAAYSELIKLHGSNPKVLTYKAAIGLQNSTSDLYYGLNKADPNDLGLVSSLKLDELKRWETTHLFATEKVRVETFQTFLKKSIIKTFDFITIDAEGYDIDILRQINLDEVKCKLLCIEWNSIPEIEEQIIHHVQQFWNPVPIYRSGENLIYEASNS